MTDSLEQEWEEIFQKTSQENRERSKLEYVAHAYLDQLKTRKEEILAHCSAYENSLAAGRVINISDLKTTLREAKVLLETLGEVRVHRPPVLSSWTVNEHRDGDSASTSS